MSNAAMQAARYGALALPLAFAALPLYVHMPRYYAETAGIELSLLGLILLGARALDAGSDPLLGWLVDRLPRRRVLLISLPVFAAGFVALLHPPAARPLPWLIGALMLTYLGYSAASIAHQAWAVDLADDAAARTRLVAAREGFGLCGLIVASVVPSLAGDGFAAGVRQLGWLLPPLLLACAALAFARGGATHSVPAALDAASFFHRMRSVLGDAAFRRLLVVFVCNGIAAALPATLFLFYVADVLRAEPLSGGLLALYIVAGAASLPLWVKLAARHGRVAAWRGAMLLAMVSFAGAGLLGEGDVVPFALICVASGLALGADLALPGAIAADIGARMAAAGACFGVWNFIAKLSLALAAGLALPLVDWFGYVPGSGHGQPALAFTYALLPLGFKLLALLLLARWRHYLETRP